MLIKRYLALICKDLFICKNVLIFSIMSVLLPLYLPKEALADSFDVLPIIMIAYTMFLSNVSIVYQEEKNKGIELLLTTPCTRRDIVICRYLSTLLVSLVNLSLFFVTVFVVTKKMVFINFYSAIIFFIVCLYLSLFIPVTFKFKAMVSSIVSSVVFFPLLTVSQFQKISAINSSFACISLILLSFVFVILSTCISLKIYKKKDF